MKRSTENVSYLQTAGRALKILMMFQEEDTLPLGTIASRMNVSTTVAYRLVYTLTTEGFLYQNPETKQYMLGDQAILLGFCTVQRQEVKRVAHDLLWDFFERTGYSISLTIPCAGKSLCVDRIMSSMSGRTASIFTGGLYPLHRGASNRVLLAFMPEEERRAALNELELAPEERRQLEQELAESRKRGYDFTQSDLPGGLFAIACPIFNSNNHLVAGLSIDSSVVSLQEGTVEKMIDELRVLSVNLNTRMGATRYPTP